MTDSDLHIASYGHTLFSSSKWFVTCTCGFEEEDIATEERANHLATTHTHLDGHDT